jgi:hypothetical protein
MESIASFMKIRQEYQNILARKVRKQMRERILQSKVSQAITLQEAFNSEFIDVSEEGPASIFRTEKYTKQAQAL